MKLSQALYAAVVASAVAVSFAPTQADAYAFTVYTVNQGGTSFNAVQGGAPAGGITANFTYTGPLSFNLPLPNNSSNSGDLNSSFFTNPSTITNYACTSASCTLPGPSSANFTTLSTFLASSGSASVYQYGSLYTIDLGVLAAGTVLTVTHDDGASIYQNGSRVDTNFVTGPTTQVTDTVKLPGTADTVLYYARENGAPSVLGVGVPEPMSIAIIGSGLIGLGIARRKRNRAN